MSRESLDTIIQIRTQRIIDAEQEVDRLSGELTEALDTLRQARHDLGTAVADNIIADRGPSHRHGTERES